MLRCWTTVTLFASLIGLTACGEDAGSNGDAVTSPVSDDDDADDDTAASDDDTSDDDASNSDDDAAVGDDDTSDDDTADDDSNDDDAVVSGDDMNADDAGTDDDSSDPDVCECSDCEEAVEVTTAFHVTDPIERGDEVPTGGDHNPCWGAWGVHDEPLPADNFVHNMEHGGVVLMYDCPDGCPDEIARMAEFVEQHELTILTEYTAMAPRFAVAAWGYRLGTDCLDMDAVASFYDTHLDHAPEQFGRPPPGPPASCE